MKITISVIITALIIASGIVLTAPPSDQVCITIVAADQQRVTEAFGSILGLGRPATIDEISDATALWLGSQTHDYERRKNQTSFTPPPFSEGSGKLNAPTTATAPTPKAKKK